MAVVTDGPHRRRPRSALHAAQRTCLAPAVEMRFRLRKREPTVDSTGLMSLLTSASQKQLFRIRPATQTADVALPAIRS
jgi:hypothetical protein